MWLKSSDFEISRHLCFSCLDYIVVGSDSGRILILEYHPSKNMFEKIHQETFGKSGCRRIVPGQFLAVDPKGRAVMIGKSAQGTEREIVLERVGNGNFVVVDICDLMG
ncbi:splicing factor 3B subunit 3 [Salmo salar]|uniref:Splicing factor 3B subunit 3 n=1 Tax=Salmo salar TaxID=8030 RepID=B5XGV0_SALSA|nr:splicing factor 3B subunit 3 [Salmo salar]ACI70070.1 Splicing factor 3B subunit 3 [Salmo salar]|eukprot:NP_001135066.1 splicing factor 3B subunit 3 [Salmo salar]